MAFRTTLAACCIVASLAPAVQADTARDALVTVPDPQALNWKTVEGTQGAVRYANVEGDLFGKGPYAAYVTFRKGTDNGLHRHSQPLPTLVLAGTFYAVIDGARTEFPAGAYYRLPANLVHESGCTATADCLLFQYQPGPFDLKPEPR